MNRNTTFTGFVSRTWLPWLRDNRSSTTVRAYGNIVRRYGRPIDERPISSITTHDLESLMQELQLSPLSSSSLHSIECAFASVFDLATKLGLLAHSPMDTLLRHPSTKLPFTPYTTEELERIESCLPYYPGTNIFGAAMHSGLRRSQLLGISAKDFGQRKGSRTVRISHLVLEDGRYGSVIKPLEGDGHEVRMPEAAFVYLEREYRTQGTRTCEPGYDNTRQLLFVDRTGAPVSLTELGQASRAIREVSGVPSFCLKNLRRSYELRHRSSTERDA